MHKTWIKTINSFSHGITDEVNKNRSIKRTIWKLLQKADETYPPMDFKEYTSTDFLVYLLSLRTKKKKRLSSASYNAKCSSYFHLCRMYGFRQDEEFMAQITVLFKGLKQSITEEKQDGEGKIQTGKIPMSFGLYCRLNEYMLRNNTLESVFACAFLTTTWNLICRVTNTCTIHLHHMDWQNDYLSIFFAHMKNYQVGERKRDPRHIYSNPINPTVSPILSLAIYFSVINITGTKDSTLFPGTNQYKRFSKYLEKIFLEV